MARRGLSTIIDWGLLEEFEKAQVLVGYVPKNNQGEVIGKSGVTIATGFDLGSKTTDFLMNTLQLPSALVKKLYYYLGKRREDAVKALKAHPLTITKPDAQLIDEQMYFYTLRTIAADWNSLCPIPFSELPKEVKTVLFSLGYNFGAKISKSVPKTTAVAIECATRNRWKNLYTALLTFPSKNPELRRRREKEAAYLRPLIVGDAAI